MSVTWEQCKIEFVPDVGNPLIDLYIKNTTLDDWNAFLAFARSYGTCTFKVDSEPANLPGDAAAIFADQQERSQFLAITFHGIQVNCHFFCVAEIELDFDPRQVCSSERFESLKRFAEGLCQSLKREAIFTPEGSEELVFLSYEPLSNSWRHHPRGAIR